LRYPLGGHAFAMSEGDDRAMGHDLTHHAANRSLKRVAGIMVVWFVQCSFPPLNGAMILPPNGFDSGSNDGWTAGLPSARPAIQPDGGPLGEDDPFLLVTAQGGNGPASKLAVFQEAPEWTGDLKTAGVDGVSVDLRNPSSSNPLDLRLVLFGPRSTNNRWTSTEPVSVPNDGSWQSYFFPISESSLTRTLGNSTYDDVIQGTIRLMLRHDSGPPSSTGTSIRAQLGIDNIAFVSSLVGDYNRNGQLDAADLDLQAAGMMVNDLSFDLDGDDDTDFDDRVKWIRELQESWLGDSNFDGEFNSADFVAVFQVGKYEQDTPATYAEGDWDGDLVFASGDFVVAFQDGGFEQGPQQVTAAVPEPSTPLLMALSLSIGLSLSRRQTSKTPSRR
jgi:hypothetical protein